MALARRVVLALGVLGPVLFLAADFHGASITPGYSQVSDPVGWLTARGTAPGLTWMFVVAALMEAGFGLAVRALYGGRVQRMVLAGALIFVWAVIGAAVAALLPMDAPGTAASFTGILHTLLVTIATLALIGAVVMARALPDVAWFGAFSTACLVVMFVGAALVGIAGVFGWQVLGLADRLTQWGWSVWLVVLAVLCIADDMRQG